MAKHDWSNPQTLVEWNGGQFPNNPLRPELIDILVSVMKDLYQAGKWTLDIGMGSGLIEVPLFGNIPEFRVVGVDSSPDMLALADQRLSGYGERYQRLQYDFAQLETLQLPPLAYQFVISVQALHHLTPEGMQAAYRYIYKTLEDGGYFLLVDRVRVAAPSLYPLYQSLWRRLDRIHGGKLASHEGVTFEQHEQIVAERGDLPVTSEEHVRWLQEAGFEAAIVYVHTNRALIAARKPNR